MKHVWIVALLAVVSCGDSTSQDASYSMEAEDLGRTQEARSYMDGDGAVWAEGFDVDELREKIDALYDAGAQEVVFADIVDFQGTDVSAWLVVKLPAHPMARGKVFTAYNEMFADYLGERTNDRGQKHLDIPLD